MLNQREYDIANTEAEVEIEQLIREWFRDYLGPRGTENGIQNAGGYGPEGAQVQPAPDAEIPAEA